MSTSDQLRLMQAIIKRIMDALGDAMQMYDDYAKIHGNEVQGEKQAEAPIIAKQAEQPRFAERYRQRLYEERMRKEKLNQELDKQGYRPPKEQLSYGQRIAALRNIKQREEKEQKQRQKPSLPASKESKQNSAFILYLQEKKENMLQEYPQLKPKQIMKLLAENWKSMTEEEKKPFYRENMNNRKQFDKKFQEYYSTIQYQQKRARRSKPKEDSYQQEDLYFQEDPQEQE